MRADVFVVSWGVHLLALQVLATVIAAPVPAAPAPSPTPGEPAPWARLHVPRCAKLLKDAGAHKYRFTKAHRVKPVAIKGHPPLHCHVPQRVIWRKGPGKFTYSGLVVVNCRMALALATFERHVQQTAKAIFGPRRRVVRVIDYGTYACRPIRGFAMLSEHAFGNAIDIARFKVRGYGEVSVFKHWKSKRKRHAKARKFLHQLVASLRRDKVFSTILTPDYNKAHANHLHLDLNYVRWGNEQ